MNILQISKLRLLLNHHNLQEDMKWKTHPRVRNIKVKRKRKRITLLECLFLSLLILKRIPNNLKLYLKMPSNSINRSSPLNNHNLKFQVPTMKTPKSIEQRAIVISKTSQPI